MARDLLNSLTSVRWLRHRPTTSAFTFQHSLCHDLESLVWVVVYAMMIHQRNIFAATDPEMFELYQEELDHCWAAHAYRNLLISHDHMMVTGCIDDSQDKVSLWFSDPREAASFSDAMRLILHSKMAGQRITYEGLGALFRDHINLSKAQQALAFDGVSK